MKPGRTWRLTRILTQLAVWLALLSTPFLGGWQRSDAPSLSAWQPLEGETPAFTAGLSAASGGRALEATPLLGAAVGARYFGVPMIDPVAGAMSITRTLSTTLSAFAWALPLLVALFAGRLFCGWFCPFGSLARIMRVVGARLPFRTWALGPRRPARWVLLVACLVTGAFGSQLVVTLALPHLVLTQSIYSLWLGGGGGAVLGWLIGLVAAGLVFGSTTYCASLCPTGALLGLFGKARRLRLRIAETGVCPPACRRCDLACWLSLRPASGDAGGDCDMCARCASACPRDNLRVGFITGGRRALPVVTVLALAMAGAAEARDVRPSLVIDEVAVVEGVDVALGVLDLSEVRLDADAVRAEGGSEVRVRLVRGPVGEPVGGKGRLGKREHFAGPLTVRVSRGDEVLGVLEWGEPNSPRSTVRRWSYVGRLDAVITSKDQIEVIADGWLRAPARFVVRSPSPGGDHAAFFWWLGISFFVMCGALSLALGLSQRSDPVRH